MLPKNDQLIENEWLSAASKRCENPSIQCIFMKHLLSPRTAAYGISSDNTEISYFQTYVNRKAQNGSFLTQEMRI